MTARTMVTLVFSGLTVFFGLLTRWAMQHVSDPTPPMAMTEKIPSGAGSPLMLPDSGTLIKYMFLSPFARPMWLFLLCFLCFSFAVQCAFLKKRAG